LPEFSIEMGIWLNHSAEKIGSYKKRNGRGGIRVVYQSGD
jgi:hypothetical protein